MFYNKESKSDVWMMRAHLPPLNPRGGGRVVNVFDPKLVEEVFRNEGKYPVREVHNELFIMLKNRRPGKKVVIYLIIYKIDFRCVDERQ